MSTTPRPRNGRIITFYSYKGGTGRSMALANVGWLLASQGNRVLLIDWDFEAPGLHRYLSPFLADPELASSPGLIDFFCDFVAAGRVAKMQPKQDERWFEANASLVRYAMPIEWAFKTGTAEQSPAKVGGLELVAAGRQDAGYPIAVTSFDWSEFYEKLGGGVFLEALKQKLRNDYDFVLIDSRTGISDTSGICTVHMPDEVVLLFTMNRQNMYGAAAVAASATAARRKSTGEPGLRIWPIATRIELAEKDRLDAAREECRGLFDKYIGHLSRHERSRYWGSAEVTYQPYYAYEEVLSVFADQPFATGSMLAQMEVLAGRIAGRPVSLARIPETLRAQTKARFQRALKPKTQVTAPQPQRAFVHYRSVDRPVVSEICAILQKAGVKLWLDKQNLRPGDDWQQALQEGMAASDVVLVFVSPSSANAILDGDDGRMLREQVKAGRKRIIPVFIEGCNEVPPILARTVGAQIPPRGSSEFSAEVGSLAEALQRLLGQARDVTPLDPDDPQKGQWGGQSHVAGRELVASVRPLSTDFFEILLEVRRTDGDPLAGMVTFYLHPTFDKAEQEVPVASERAALKAVAWGAFTVGAVADGGKTRLELDLAQVESFPALFRER